MKAFEAYPAEYRPQKTHRELIREVEEWRDERIVFGVFCREDDRLCGYATVSEYNTYCILAQQKVIPEYEKMQINAALVDGVLLYYNERIKNGYKLVDGQRNVLHQTGFQDYLIKYFGFRKAYCRLNIKYRGWVGVAVKILYPFKNWISRKKGKVFLKINGVLKMEEIRRTF